MPLRKQAVPQNVKYTVRLCQMLNGWFYDPAIKAHVHTKTYTGMFIAAFFMMVPSGSNSNVHQWAFE